MTRKSTGGRSLEVSRGWKVLEYFGIPVQCAEMSMLVMGLAWTSGERKMTDVFSHDLKIFLIQMFGHEIKTKSNFQRVRYVAWSPTENNEEPPF